MSRSNYTCSTASIPRQPSSHASSSAFSSSANPDEDWTQISDLAERRRIQNRIAQRNYRKKLKRRLEDLERRAGSSSASPPPSYLPLQAQKQISPKIETKTPCFQSQKSSDSSSSSLRQMSYSPYSSPPTQTDSRFIADNDRYASTSPPLFPHSHFYNDDTSLYSYSSFRQPVANDYTTESYSDYFPSNTGTPAMSSVSHFAAVPISIKRELSAAHNEPFVNPFNQSYAMMAGLADVKVSHTFEDSNPLTPPLLSRSFSDNSDIYNNFPGTPMSLPASPPMMLRRM